MTTRLSRINRVKALEEARRQELEPPTIFRFIIRSEDDGDPMSEPVVVRVLKRGEKGYGGDE